MVATREDLASLQTDLGVEIHHLMPRMEVQPIDDYIEHEWLEVWKNCFYKVFKSLIKSARIQKNCQWSKQFGSLQVLKWIVHK